MFTFFLAKPRQGILKFLCLNGVKTYKKKVRGSPQEG